MRDAVVIPFNGEEMLVITTDNSGSIGMKELDNVTVPYETVSYYSLRVAIMECMAAGASPVSVVIQNFCGNEAWDELTSGVQRGLSELRMENIPITGSSETNFSLSQSAIGINIIGKKPALNSVKQKDLQDKKAALIGLPLVGDEVVVQADDIAPLSIFKEICDLQDVMVWPVGSKGVLSELKRMYPGFYRSKITPASEIDLLKSGGPSTSFLITYPIESERRIKEIAGNYFNKL
ncbi:ATP-binding protein [Virgibacillus profundi]|uniref:ATP-binding protein n=1 Tax=Virgibacillus profundi TaxID=2024555 RepID=A0A2A2IAA7_9BACI|nr:ATP-binding protein [Virgibacillus profundi]PAV27983.1 ATP-binding protein [Virgibacillus profundi]PXY52161.1 ATP-binding protein [Virgibacillus profundi]